MISVPLLPLMLLMLLLPVLVGNVVSSILAVACSFLQDAPSGRPVFRRLCGWSGFHPRNHSQQVVLLWVALLLSSFLQVGAVSTVSCLGVVWNTAIIGGVVNAASAAAAAASTAVNPTNAVDVAGLSVHVVNLLGLVRPCSMALPRPWRTGRRVCRCCCTGRLYCCGVVDIPPAAIALVNSGAAGG